MKYCLIALLLALTLLASTPPAQAQQRPQNTVTIKFEPMPEHGGPIITVRLEHVVTARLLVDTGATDTALTPDLVAKLKVPVEEQPLRRRKIVILSHLEIGSWDTPGGEFMVLEGPILPTLKELKIDGVLGTNFLKTCAVFLNWEKQEFSLFYPGTLPKEQVTALGFTDQEATPVPLTLDGSNLHGVDTQVAGKTIRLLVDTGRQKTILPKSFFKGLSDKPIWERPALTYKGVYKESVYLVPSITVGKAEVGKRAVLAARDDSGPLARMLGMDFLAQFNVLLDFPAQRLYLHQLAGTNLSLEHSYQDSAEGLVIGRDKDLWKIVSIESGSRFFRAGVRQGDVIEAVNETNVDGMVSDQVLAELHRIGTPTLRVTRLQDGTKQKRIVLVPKR